MLLEIAIALIIAKILNFLFEKAKQPGVIGEIFAGIIIGPCCLSSLSGSTVNLFGTTLFKIDLNFTSPEFKEISFIGVVFLLFIIGLETDTNQLKHAGKSGMFAAIFGIFIPLMFGFILGSLFNFGATASLAIGAIFFATSITITVRTLSDLDMLSTRVGLTLNAAVIITDIIGIFIFSLIVGQDNPLVLLLRVTIFFVLTVGAGVLIIKYATKRGATSKTAMIVFTVGLAVCFLFASFAEDMGLAAIIGAFFAGLIIRKTPQAFMISNYIKTIGYAFFIPLFFVWVGASFNFFYLAQSKEIFSLLLFITIFVVLGLAGNFIGGALGARVSGLNKKESLSVGIGMMPVMGVALIIVTTEIDKGIFGEATGMLAQQVKTATVLLIIVSCLAAPTLLKLSMASSYFKKKREINLEAIYGHVNPKPSRDPQMSNLRKLQLLKHVLVLILFIQCFLLILYLKGDDKYEIISAMTGVIIGSCFAYVALKHILSKQIYTGIGTKKLNIKFKN